MKRKVLLTESDVLDHSYGVSTPTASVEIQPAIPPTLPSPPPPPPPPVVAVPPLPPPPPPPPPPSAPTISVEEAPAEIGALENEPVDSVSVFIDKYTKTELIKMAQDAGLDTIGNKTQLAKRLAEAGIVPNK